LPVAGVTLRAVTVSSTTAPPLKSRRMAKKAGSSKQSINNTMLKMGRTRVAEELQSRGSVTLICFVPFHQQMVASRATSGVVLSSV